MSFHTVQLPSGRWGIFNGQRLLLTVGSQHTLDMILNQLISKQIPVQVLSDEHATSAQMT
ncbi:MAG: hypothetical protein AAFO84_05000 [Cyanobacteria bacterium J06598_1]